MRAHMIRTDSLYTLVVRALASDLGGAYAYAFLGSAAQCFRCFGRGNGGCVCFSFGTKSFSSFRLLHHRDLDREWHVSYIAAPLPAVIRSTCPCGRVSNNCHIRDCAHPWNLTAAAVMHMLQGRVTSRRACRRISRDLTSPQHVSSSIAGAQKR